MKQRVISSLVGLVLLAVALFFFNTLVPDVVISLISVVAVLEILAAAGCDKSKVVTVFSVLVSALVPFMSFAMAGRMLFPISYVFVMVLFFCLLRQHESLRIEQVAVGFMFSLLIPMSLASLLSYRDDVGSARGILYVFVVFGSGWLGDTCAYFAGRAFGRHKLAPKISPKKTVEGAIGGIIGAAVLLPMLLAVCSAVCDALGAPVDVHYWRVAAMTPLFATMGIIGDLSASVIKRQYGVKDFGSIMPGHGGVMDRFDSVLMIAPLVYVVSRFLPLVD